MTFHDSSFSVQNKTFNAKAKLVVKEKKVNLVLTDILHFWTQS